MTLVSHNRFEVALRDLFTSLTQPVPVAVTLRPGEAFTSFARRVQSGVFTAVRHGIYDIDQIPLVELRALGERIHQEFFGIDFFVNYAPGSAPGPHVSAAPGELEWVPTGQLTGPAFQLFLGGLDRLHLDLEVDLALLDRAVTEDFVRGVDRRVDGLFSHVDVTVDQLLGA